MSMNTATTSHDDGSASQAVRSLPQQGGRVDSYDVAKGIAIILVVFGHAERGLVAAGVMSDSALLHSIDYAIYTFHMPIFFFISGLFFRTRPLGDPKPWIDRVIRIAYPYVLWSLVLGGIQIALSGSGATNNPMTVSRLLAIAWWPISPFWFLYALFAATVLTALTQTLRADVVAAVAFAGFSAALLLGPSTVGDVAYAFFYMSLGRLFAETVPPARDVSISLPGMLSLAIAFGAAIILSLSAGVPERWPVLAAVTGIAAVIAVARTAVQRHGSALIVRALRTAGIHSFGIFVLHIPVIGLLRLIVYRVAPGTEPWLFVAATTPVVAAIAVVVQHVAARLSVDRVLGMPLSAPRTSRPG